MSTSAAAADLCAIAKKIAEAATVEGFVIGWFSF